METREIQSRRLPKTSGYVPRGNKRGQTIDDYPFNTQAINANSLTMSTGPAHRPGTASRWVHIVSGKPPMPRDGMW